VSDRSASGERLEAGVEIRWDAAADKHEVPRECTLSVVLGHRFALTQSYLGRPCLRWRNRPDADGCHVLDVLAEDHRQNRPPYVIVFHSQPFTAPQPRRGQRNRR